ncbi:MAG TPA: hypothetical protein VF193_13400 [Steroidobacter sp.]
MRELYAVAGFAGFSLTQRLRAPSLTGPSAAGFVSIVAEMRTPPLRQCLSDSLVSGAVRSAIRRQDAVKREFGMQNGFQDRVAAWLLECFGEQIANNLVERNQRFLEEALELVQACGCTRQEVLKLVDYVYGRPPGEIEQEVGGVAVTLAALCYARGLRLENCAEAEIEYIRDRIQQIRAKRAGKPKIAPLAGTAP